MITFATGFRKESFFASFIYASEEEYSIWTTPKHVFIFLKSRSESISCNILLATLALITLLFISMDLTVKGAEGVIISAIDLGYNIVYAVFVGSNLLNDCVRFYNEKQTYFQWYIIDIISYSHYIAPYVARKVHFIDIKYVVKIICYYLRLNRPFRFLWGLNDHYLKGSVACTMFKYWYILTILRIAFTNVIIWLGRGHIPHYTNVPEWLLNPRTRCFYREFYIVFKRFCPIGVDVPPADGDEEGRALQILADFFGYLLVTGITIASLAVTIGLHIYPEEMFRARVRLIMNDMKATNVPELQRTRAETFYRMYWHKQKAVSESRLLPTYPPTLENTINTDIYFEALQKSVLLRELSYQFLSELAKHMRTINYIPGDIIIKRNNNKYAMMYISYGDVEMLSAEDDDTPILRFTRGSIMNPCAAAAPIASSTNRVCIRAATFCTVHVLKAIDIWRVCAKYEHFESQGYILQSSFHEHFIRVIRHYSKRNHPQMKYKSSILVLKRNLMELHEARDEDNELLLGRQDVFLEIAGCYVMRNQKEAALTEESDSICVRTTFPCILQPFSSLLLTWKIWVAVLTIVVTIVHPYNLVFIDTPQVDFNFFDHMTTFVFLVDILVHLSTGVKIEEGVPITFEQTCSNQIASLWLVFDLLAALPIFEFIGHAKFSGVNKFFKLPKVFKVLKEQEDISLYQSNLFRFLSYCLIFLLLNWLVATLQQGYMCFQEEYCNVISITTQPFWGRGPLDDSDEAIGARIRYSLYWAISFVTFTAHKTLKAAMYNWKMQFFIIVLLEICGLFCMVLQAVYSATIMVKHSMSEQYKSCIQTVKTFLIKNDVDPVLRYRFINYLQLCWFTDKYLPNDIIKNLCAKAHLFYTSPQEILLNTGDISNEIYVIKQGFCEVIDPDTKETVDIISAKGYFADFECLMRVPAYYTIRAVSHVQIFSISRKHLTKAIAIPKIKDAIVYTRTLQEYLALLKNRREPFLKYEMPAPPPSRAFFPILRKYEPDTAFLQPFQRLGFFSITRYVFPRFTIRPDGPYLRRYEWFRAACAFLTAHIFPIYYILLLQFDWLKYVGTLLDMTAYYDILQRLLVAYYNEKGVLIYHPVSTAAHYIRGAMLVDLLGCMPFEYFDDLRGKMYSTNEYVWVADTMQYLMCNRFLQLYRLPAALDFLENYIDRRDTVFVLKAIPILMVFLMAVTSFMVLYSVNIYGLTAGGWLLKPLSTSAKIPSWILTNKDKVGYNITETPVNLVITVYYWVVYEITNNGYNIFQPNNNKQLSTLIICMLLGSIMITYFSVRVLSLRSNVNQALAAFQEHLKDLVIFMERENVSKELYKEVLSYYEYTWEKTGGTDYRSIFKLCDQITLRTDAILHIYGQTFIRCPVLYKSDISLQRLLGRAVHSVYFRAGMTVVERLDVIKNLYFVDYGVMESRNPLDDDLVTTKLPRGSVFGNFDEKFLVVSPNKFVASSNIHLLKIEAWLFFKILKDFPTINSRVAKFRPRDENYIIGSPHGKRLAVWRDRAVSTAIIVVTKRGILKYLHHHGKMIQIILIIASTICVFGDLYNATFQDNDEDLITTLYVMDVLFILKVAMNYFLPLLSEEKSESRSALILARQKYYHGEFRLHFLSIVPIEIFCFLFENRWSAFAWLRLNRVIRITTIHNTLKEYRERLSINVTAFTIATMMIWFTLFVHFISCLWYLLGVLHDYYEPQSSWRWKQSTMSLTTGKTYICNNEYICSMYFVLSTFSKNGVGDILPRQQTEVVFVCWLMVISTMMFMIYVGEFANIMQYRFFRCFKFYRKYLELKGFLKYNRVSRNLAKLTDKYTLHLWRTSRGLQVPRFLDDAPHCLRQKLMAAAYMRHLMKHPAFKYCQLHFLRHLVGYFKPFTYHEDMYVVREGEITNSMYFIHHGRVQELFEDTDEEIQTFEKDTFFGTAQGLSRSVPYTYSYKTLTKAQVLTLNFDDWAYLLQLFPKNKDTIYKPRKAFQQEKENIDMMKRSTSLRRMQSTKKFGTSLAIQAANDASAATDIQFESPDILKGKRPSVKFRRESDLELLSDHAAEIDHNLTGIPSGRKSDAFWPSGSSRFKKGEQDIDEDDDEEKDDEETQKPKIILRRKSILRTGKAAAVREKLEQLSSSKEEGSSKELSPYDRESVKSDSVQSKDESTRVDFRPFDSPTSTVYDTPKQDEVNKKSSINDEELPSTSHGQKHFLSTSAATEILAKKKSSMEDIESRSLSVKEAGEHVYPEYFGKEEESITSSLERPIEETKLIKKSQDWRPSRPSIRFAASADNLPIKLNEPLEPEKPSFDNAHKRTSSFFRRIKEAVSRPSQDKLPESGKDHLKLVLDEKPTSTLHKGLEGHELQSTSKQIQLTINDDQPSTSKSAVTSMPKEYDEVRTSTIETEVKKETLKTTSKSIVEKLSEKFKTRNENNKEQFKPVSKKEPTEEKQLEQLTIDDTRNVDAEKEIKKESSLTDVSSLDNLPLKFKPSIEEATLQMEHVFYEEDVKHETAEIRHEIDGTELKTKEVESQESLKHDDVVKHKHTATPTIDEPNEQKPEAENLEKNKKEVQLKDSPPSSPTKKESLTDEPSLDNLALKFKPSMATLRMEHDFDEEDAKHVTAEIQHEIHDTELKTTLVVDTKEKISQESLEHDDVIILKHTATPTIDEPKEQKQKGEKLEESKIEAQLKDSPQSSPTKEDSLTDEPSLDNLALKFKPSMATLRMEHVSDEEDAKHETAKIQHEIHGTELKPKEVKSQESLKHDDVVILKHTATPTIHEPKEQKQEGEKLEESKKEAHLKDSPQSSPTKEVSLTDEPSLDNLTLKFKPSMATLRMEHVSDEDDAKHEKTEIRHEIDGTELKPKEVKSQESFKHDDVVILKHTAAPTIDKPKEQKPGAEKQEENKKEAQLKDSPQSSPTKEESLTDEPSLDNLALKFKPSMATLRIVGALSASTLQIILKGCRLAQLIFGLLRANSALVTLGDTPFVGGGGGGKVHLPRCILQLISVHI